MLKNKEQIEKGGALLIVRAALPSFLIVFITIGFLFSVFYWWASSSLFSNLSNNERKVVDLQVEKLRFSLDSTFGDLRFLKQNHTIERLLLTDFQNFTEIQHDLIAFSGEKGLYDQVRVLDKNGMERLRVNYNDGSPAVVTPDKLQDKSKRYYFTETFKLGPDQIYISPLDLNIENGKIEQPLKPMIRIGMPLFSGDGEKKAILLLNFLAAGILNSFDNLAEQAVGEGMLLNRDGYWLTTPKKSDEWGFMYQEGKETTFALRYQEEWNRIKSKDVGQFKTDRGLFTFSRIRPLNEKNVIPQGEEGYFWMVVSHVPPVAIAQQVQPIRQTLLFSFLLLIATVLAFSVVRANLRISRENARLQLTRKNKELEESQKLLKAAMDESLATNEQLVSTVSELEEALDQIKTLQGIVPICSYCKEIRNDEGYWVGLENYIEKHSHAEFSHSICDSCLDKHFPEDDDEVNL